MKRRMQKSLSGFSIIAMLIVLVAFLSGSVLGQDTERANLRGTVTDSSGGVIPNATLTVTNLATNVSIKTTSDSDGNYAFRFLPAGRYKVIAEMSQFGTVTVTDIVLRVSIDTTIPIMMKPGAVTETLTVTAESNQIETSDATLKYTVTNEQVRGLPVFTSTVGRTLLDKLVFLVPGVTPSSFGAGTRGEDMTINGSRRQSQSFNFDGGDNNDPEFGRAASSLPNPDVVQEFTVITNNYQADLGRTSGGVINATTKSGTNQLHGNLRYFLLNEAFNARGFFDPERPKQRLNTFGGQVGGPVYVPWLYNGRDRTHFFFDMEGTKSDRESLFSRDLISLKERAGDFSSLPQAQWPRDPLTGQAFPNGKIPDARISPVAKEYLKRFIPEPNNGERTFTKFIPSSDNNSQFTIRIDHQVTGADMLTGTYFRSITKQDTSSTTTLPVGSNQVSDERNQNFVLRETHTFSSRSVNQFSGAITRFFNSFFIDTPSLRGVHPKELGITGVTPQTGAFLAPPTVVISGTGVQTTVVIGTGSAKTTWQIIDDFSHIRGKHALKFGGEVKGFLFNKNSANSNGSFGFSTTNTFGTRNAIADFIIGSVNSFSQSTGQSYYPRQKAYYFYALDDWRVRPNLTLNFGLRYELVPPLVDQLDQFSAFRPGIQSQRLPQAPLGLIFVGDPDPILGTLPRGTYPTDKNSIAPRLGIVYTPKPKSGWLHTLFGDGKTAIRTGWGVFYDQIYGFSATQTTSTQPFSVSISRAASEINTAGGTFANPWGSVPNPFPLDVSKRVFSGTQSIQPISPDFRTAYTYQYNLTFQRELPKSLLFEFGYVGSNSFKLNTEVQRNPAIVGPGATSGNVQNRRIFQLYRSLPEQHSIGRARYDSFQTRLSRRFRRGLMFDGSYVFAKSMDDGSEPQVSQLGGLTVPRWAPSRFDRRHQFVVSYTYDLPTTSRGGVLGRLINGWQIGGITQFRTGTPLDIGQTPDPTLNGVNISSSGTTDYVGPYTQFDPRRYQTLISNGVARSGNYFFDPSAFRLVVVSDYTQARQGNLGRHVFYGPGLNQWDASFIKRTRIAETHQIEIRADVINLFNHAQFIIPQGQTTNSSTFGQVSTYYAGPGRNMQISVRYTF